MARSPSKIMTAAEIKAESKNVKVELSQVDAALKANDKALTAAKKKLEAAVKAADSVLAKAQKEHAAAMKAANKDFEVETKGLNKAGDGHKKQAEKLQHKLAALTPATETAAA